MRALAILPVAALCAAATGQNFVVSPLSATSAEANSNNTIPWWSPSGRYQQIHGDLRGAPRAFQGIFLRKDAINLASGVARTVDVELYTCDSSFAGSSTTFASNYIGTPTRVIDRKNINLPDITTSQGSPEPWNIAFPFDRPGVYTGQNDFLWEVVMYSNTATGTYALDAYSGTDTATGPTLTLGTGCIPFGKTSAMGLSGRITARRSDNTHGVTWSVSRGPNSQAGVLLLGPADPNSPVPGLCVNVRTAPLIDIPIATNTSGGYSLPAIYFGFQAANVGLKLYSQAFVLDPGQSGLPLSGTNGLETTAPDLPPPSDPLQRIYSNSSSATTGSKETYAYGLVTRFLY